MTILDGLAGRAALGLLFAFGCAACGSDAPAARERAPEASLAVESTVEATVEAPTDPTVEEPPHEGTPDGTEESSAEPPLVAPTNAEAALARRALESMLAELEPREDYPEAPHCTMGCVYQNEDRLVSVMSLSNEYSESPADMEIRVVGRDPSQRALRVDGNEDDDAWTAYADGEGPPPWLGALRRAMPTLEGSRPANDLVTTRVTHSFGLSEYAPLVHLGGSFEGRYLFFFTGRYAHHLYLVHGTAHQMRWVASLPIRAENWDGMFLTTTRVQPIGIDRVFEVPGSPSLLLQLFHPAAGHDGIDRFSTLLVPVDDGSALTEGTAQEQAEIEASLGASGPRVRAFSAELREGEPCDAGCVYFRRDHTFTWAFPELLDGHGEAPTYALRRLDGTIASHSVPRESIAAEIAAELEEAEGSLARELINRSVVAAWEGVAYSPQVELGPPHMRRRLSFVQEGDEEVLYWLEADARTEVGRLAHGTDSGPWGIDRVLAPQGAGYPLIVVATAAVAPSWGDTDIRHQVALLVVTHSH